MQRESDSRAQSCLRGCLLWLLIGLCAIGLWIMQAMSQRPG
jgi:hypothetical protein